jgi:hypothetical protein
MAARLPSFRGFLIGVFCAFCAGAAACSGSTTAPIDVDAASGGPDGNGSDGNGPDGTDGVDLADGETEAASHEPGDSADEGDGGEASGAGDAGDAVPRPLCPAPLDVTGWTTPALKPRKTSSACSAQEIIDYDSNCLNPTTTSVAACDAFSAAHNGCAACLNSRDNDPTWGPLVAFSVLDINLGGCVLALDPSSAACAQSAQDDQVCVHLACDYQCPITDEPSYDRWTQCIDNARAQPCRAHSDAAKCVASLDAGAICTPTADMDTAFLAIAPLFCGGGPVDAGALDGH